MAMTIGYIRGGSAGIAGALRIALLCLLAVLPAACDSVEERAEQHYESGMALLAEGNPVKASLEFRNAIKLNDSHVDANMELGKIYQESRDYSAAVFQYRKVIEIDATRVEAHIRLGQLMLAFGQVENALTSSIAAAQLAPNDPDVLILEASTALRLGNNDQAREKVDAVMAIDPDFGDAWVVLSALSRRAGDMDKSLEQINEAIRRDPTNTKALLFRLDLLSKMGRIEELGAALAGLAEDHPDEIAYQDALVRYQLATGAHDKAEITLRTISRLAPDDTARALDIVELIGRTRGAEAALVELQRLIDAREGTEAAYPLEIAMAEIEMSQRKLDAAQARLTRLISVLGDSKEGVDARIRLARIRFVNREYEDTARLIAEALARDANNAEALTLRGRLRIAEEDYESAIRDLRAAEGENPDALETVQLLALAYQRNGNGQLAGERLAAAVELSGQATDAVLQYAAFLVREGKQDFAATLLEEVIAKRPEEARLVDALARLRLQMQDYAEVERLSRRLREIAETPAAADQLMAAALSGQKRYEETISLLSSARGAEGETYLAALVATHLRNDDLPSAAALIEDALANNPGDSEALRLKGALAVVQGDMDAARELLEQAVAAGPDVATNYAALSRFEGQTISAEKAEQTVREGIERTGDPGLRFSLAGLLERRGALAEAIEQYEILYERQPGSQLVANNLASLLTDTDPGPEQIQRAYVISKRLKDTDVPHFKDTYGWVQHLQGDNAEALSALRAAAEALPDNPVVQYHLGAVLVATGDPAGARAALTRAIELGGDSPLPQIDRARELLAGLPAAAGD